VELHLSFPIHLHSLSLDEAQERNVHQTTHGTPTRKKENRNSKDKRENVKRRKNGYNDTHKEYARIKSGRRPRKGRD
jgi:hypothetical protein